MKPISVIYLCVCLLMVVMMSCESNSDFRLAIQKNDHEAEKYRLNNYESKIINGNTIIYRYLGETCSKCLISDAYLIRELENIGFNVIVIVNRYSNRNDSLALDSILRDIQISCVDDSLFRTNLESADRFFAYINIEKRMCHIYYPSYGNGRYNNMYKKYLSKHVE